MKAAEYLGVTLDELAGLKRKKEFLDNEAGRR
jgi:hypothetical protein